MKTNRDSAILVDRVVIQTIYAHGGSRIYTETKQGGDRELLVDTYWNAEFAEAVFAFTKAYLATKAKAG